MTNPAVRTQVAAQDVHGEQVSTAVVARSLSSLLKDRWFLLLIVAAVTARLYHFTRPPDDAHEWRQTETLVMAASYGHGAPWLVPEGSWYGLQSLPVVLEFPAYSIVTYWLSRAFGLLTGARVASLAFSLAAIVVFDRICALGGHPRRRTATALLALAPIAIFYGHATQPDSLLLLLLLGAAYCALRTGQGGPGWAVAAAALLAGASTIKPTALVSLAPPLAYLAWKTRRPGRFVLIVGVAGLATMGWAAFDRAVLLQGNPGWYSVNTAPAWVLGTNAQRLSPSSYGLLATRAAMILLPPLTVGLVVRAAGDRAGDPFWWWWLAGGIMAILVFINLSVVHLYYELPLVPALAALAAAGAPVWPRQVALRVVGAAVLLAAAAIGCRDLYAESPIHSDAGTALASIATPGRPVLALSQNGNQLGYPTVVYYSGRSGWPLPLTADAEMIDALPGAPACELVMVLDGPAPAGPPKGWREVGRTAEYVLARRIGSGCPTGSDR